VLKTQAFSAPPRDSGEAPGVPRACPDCLWLRPKSRIAGPVFSSLEWRPNNSFKPNPLRGFVLNSSQTVAASPTGSSRCGSA